MYQPGAVASKVHDTWTSVARSKLLRGPSPGVGEAGRKNITQHAAVVLLFSGERGDPSDPVLRLRGTASCHHGLPSWRVLLRIAAKYYASPRALPVELRNARKWRLRSLYYGQLKGRFGYLRVVPTSCDFLSRP